ncbi:penicillin-binding protein 2 [Lutimonas saemankumensis]|uniref:penicillin-binding protein 2 n=1 Tax=Lutimonas saemankumensis TaxID=483016 RepID=UPI001CD77FB6|nr:penicillin-binding protein 2 [Lutimonas saemankumensis]MCA0930939.1 penicillin-binding protein 2 [Lutimonas saemankumensis]
MPRKSLLYFLILSVGAIFIGRLFFLQVIDSKYRQNPLNNSAVTIKFAYPDRGFIYDRNGKLMVANQVSYDIMIIPKDVEPLDTLEFCDLLKIEKEDFIKRYTKAKNYSPRIPSIFVGQVSKEDYAFLQEKMYKYKGFYIQKRFLRQYPENTSANVLGYISEVNERLLKKNNYYQLGELVGYQGIEKQYEDVLRGRKGVRFIQKNRFNKEIGPYKEGIFDTLPVPGKDISLTLDMELQMYAESLMINKRGGIVAIEPSSGEILSLVSTPSYNPNMLVGRKRSRNSVLLFNDTIKKPMLDRGLQAQYPPGSPFKIINALIALQEDVVTPETAFNCYHGFKYGRGGFMKCHCGIVGTPIAMNTGIYRSCNAYFSNVYRRTIEKYDDAQKGMDVWSNHAKSFGLGNYLGYDMPSGQRGLIPDSKLYNRYYPNHKWKAITTISNAIGQGEVLTTPIQLANMTAAIANRGYYYTPHILKKVGDSVNQNEKFTKPKYTSIDARHFEPVIDGMLNVFEIGTARGSKIEDIQICGKTGTAENFARINGERIQFTDHSTFIAFAPKDDPKIAIAVFVENGYWGSRWAAPIASLMIEKYIKGEVKRDWLEKRMLEGSLEEEYNKQLEIENYVAQKEE